MVADPTDRNLRFGILALQNNFIDREALLDGFNRWVADKARPLGRILLDRGALGADEHELLEALVAKHIARCGGEPRESLKALSSIGSVRRDLSRIADADLHASLAQVSAARFDDDPYRTLSQVSLGESTSAGRTTEAIALHESTLKLREAKLGPDHPKTLDSHRNLAGVYESLRRLSEAEGQYRDVLARRRKAVKPGSPLPAGDLAALGANLVNQSRWSEAEPVLRECLAIREKATPEDWVRYDAMSLLGGALLGNGRHAEAEPLLVAGYEGMKARESRITVPARSRLREAAERVVPLYEAWNQPGKATAWKAKLGMPDLPADVFVRP